MTGAAPRDGRFELAHWALVAACRRGVDGFEVAERVWALLDLLPGRRERPAVPGVARPATSLAHQRLAWAAREVLAAAEYTLGLGAVAARVGCSPARWSASPGFHASVASQRTLRMAG